MLTIKTNLLMSHVHGIGLFAQDFIPKDTIIWHFHPNTCQVFTPREFLNLTKTLHLNSILNFMNYSYIKDEFTHYVSDNTRFINHSLEANVAFVDNEYEIAVRDIEPGEELLENYLLS